MLNFNTTNQTFRQIMGNSLLYRVPSFQRDYSWTENEWDDLWQDIFGLFEENGESAHYMGYLVLQSSNQKQFDIIDGQQRLTTISILILASLSRLQTLVNQRMDANKNQNNVICNLPNHEQERVYNQIAYQIAQGILTDSQSIVQALKKIYPDDTLFKTAFREKQKQIKTNNSDNRQLIPYILFQLEVKTNYFG